MKQPEDDALIQDFYRDFQFSQQTTPESSRGGLKGAQNDQQCSYLSEATLRENLKLERVDDLLRILFQGPDSSQQRPPAQVVFDDYLRPFVILICIGQGPMINHFRRHGSLKDHNLPFYEKPPNFPTSSGSDVWADFKSAQWHYCPLGLSFDIDQKLHDDEILPIASIERLEAGYSAGTHKIVVDKEYDRLVPELEQKVGRLLWSASEADHGIRFQKRIAYTS